MNQYTVLVPIELFGRIPYVGQVVNIDEKAIGQTRLAELLKRKYIREANKADITAWKTKRAGIIQPKTEDTPVKPEDETEETANVKNVAETLFGVEPVVAEAESVPETKTTVDAEGESAPETETTVDAEAEAAPKTEAEAENPKRKRR